MPKIAMRFALAAGLPLLLAACGQEDPIPVAGPFYLTYFDGQEQMALFRCPDGPHGGCAIDGLPGATVFAAGADTSYVVVARHPHVGELTNYEVTQYFYFARLDTAHRAGGRAPEKIIGPLTQTEFDAAKARLKLPDFSVRIGELE